MVRTSGVRAVGQKTARAPDCSRTGKGISGLWNRRGNRSRYLLSLFHGLWKWPKRLKGAEQMVYIRADFADYHNLPRFGGISLEVITAYRDFEEVDLICYKVKMRGILPLDYI